MVDGHYGGENGAGGSTFAIVEEHDVSGRKGRCGPGWGRVVCRRVGEKGGHVDESGVGYVDAAPVRKGSVER